MDVFAGILPSESAVSLPRFQTKSGEKVIALNHIVYLSAQLNYTVFHLSDGEQVMTSLSLSTYARLLEPHGFIRLHKTYLLNGHHYGRCRRGAKNQLILPDQHQVTIARRRRTGIKQMEQ